MSSSSTQPKTNSWEVVPSASAVMALVASFFVWQWWIGVLALVVLVVFIVVVMMAAAGDYYPGEMADTIIGLAIFVVIGGFSMFVFYKAFSFGVLGIRSGALVAIATLVLFCISWRKT